MEELEEQVKKRRFAAETTRTDMSVIRALESEIRFLDKQYLTKEVEMSETEAKLAEVLKAITEVEVPDPTPQPEPVPDPTPTPRPEPPSRPGRLIAAFRSLFWDWRRISGRSLSSWICRAPCARIAQAVTQALKEILGQMKPDNRFAIIGYRGGPTYDSYPSNGQLIRADSATLSAASAFVDSMPRRFGGGTPTQAALDPHAESAAGSRYSYQ